MSRRDDLSQPSGSRGAVVHYDADTIGRLSEAVARFFGTARFLAIQTLIVVGWILLNVFAVSLRWDPYPFILLNLAFSTQAAYAAPLILLAQNRQEARDRSQAERDREITSRTQAEAEFLAREVAGIRLTMADGVTSNEVAALTAAIERLEAKVEALASPPAEASLAAGAAPPPAEASPEPGTPDGSAGSTGR